MAAKTTPFCIIQSQRRAAATFAFGTRTLSVKRSLHDLSLISFTLDGHETLAAVDPALSDEDLMDKMWSGGPAELWACLFLEHRRWRMASRDADPERTKILNRLCRQLRATLF